jgi:uncharacterized cupin superfamily protein
MSDRASELADTLIRNCKEGPLTRLLREPHYDTQGSRVARGTAAQKLGPFFDILEAGKRGCPYHLHHTQEEMFIIIEGDATLRVAGEMLPVMAGDLIFIPPDPECPRQIICTSEAPVKYLPIRTMEIPEMCKYPDSAKFLAEGGHSLRQRAAGAALGLLHGLVHHPLRGRSAPPTSPASLRLQATPGAIVSFSVNRQMNAAPKTLETKECLAT